MFHQFKRLLTQKGCFKESNRLQIFVDQFLYCVTFYKVHIPTFSNRPMQKCRNLRFTEKLFIVQYVYFLLS